MYKYDREKQELVIPEHQYDREKIFRHFNDEFDRLERGLPDRTRRNEPALRHLSYDAAYEVYLVCGVQLAVGLFDAKTFHGPGGREQFVTSATPKTRRLRELSDESRPVDSSEKWMIDREKFYEYVDQKLDEEEEGPPARIWEDEWKDLDPIRAYQGWLETGLIGLGGHLKGYFMFNANKYVRRVPQPTRTQRVQESFYRLRRVRKFFQRTRG